MRNFGDKFRTEMIEETQQAIAEYTKSTAEVIEAWAYELDLLRRERDEVCEQLNQFGWRSVNDEFPECEGIYICHFTDGTIETFSFAEDGRRHLWGANQDLVTHWMPLPAPPTEFAEEVE